MAEITWSYSGGYKFRYRGKLAVCLSHGDDEMFIMASEDAMKKLYKQLEEFDDVLDMEFSGCVRKEIKTIREHLHSG